MWKKGAGKVRKKRGREGVNEAQKMDTRYHLSLLLFFSSKRNFLLEEAFFVCLCSVGCSHETKGE